MGLFGVASLRGLSRSPSSALSHLFFWEGSPTKIDYRKQKRYPYSNLSNLEDLVMLPVLRSQIMGAGEGREGEGAQISPSRPSSHEQSISLRRLAFR